VWSSAILASLHYLALAIGLPAVFLRGRALAGSLDDDGLRRLFAADTTWGVAAILWLATGLLRVFAGLEKGSAYYLSNHTFYAKMALFGLVLILEIWPMLTFIRWRRARSKGMPVDTAHRRMLAGINATEVAIVVLIVFVASAMARGLP
jgi:putative membrane protein